MMVEFFATAIAWPTMLRLLLNIRCADDAIVRNHCVSVGPNRRKWLFLDTKFTLLVNEDISGH